MAAGAEPKGTYGVMMRERAELMRRVQAGEVSGVGLRRDRESQSDGALRALSKPRWHLPHATQLSAAPPGPTVTSTHPSLCSSALCSICPWRTGLG